MDIPQQIKITRKILKETQADFAKRFNSHANTVSRWESGEYEAPYEVIYFVFGENADQYEWEVCGKCAGKGYVSKRLKKI
jgi:transcriptional regulator with XRE-family HTH domain